MMINYVQLRTTEVPDDALAAYRKYEGNQHAAATVRDYAALAKMQAWGAFIEMQFPLVEVAK